MFSLFVGLRIVRFNVPNSYENKRLVIRNAICYAAVATGCDCGSAAAATGNGTVPAALAAGPGKGRQRLQPLAAEDKAAYTILANENADAAAMLQQAEKANAAYLARLETLAVPPGTRPRWDRSVSPDVPMVHARLPKANAPGRAQREAMARTYMALSRVNAVDYKDWAQSLRDERATGSSGRSSSLTPRDRLAAEKFDRAWAARYEREIKPGWH